MIKFLKITLGLITIAPFVYMAYFFHFMLSQFQNQLPAEQAQIQFENIFTLHLLSILVTFVLIAIYITHLFRSNAVPNEKKALWAVVLFMGNIIAMPFYWFIYIWPNHENEDQDDTQESSTGWKVIGASLVVISLISVIAIPTYIKFQENYKRYEKLAKEKNLNGRPLKGSPEYLKAKEAAKLYMQGKSYRRDSKENENNKRALALLLKSAEMGNMRAQEELGYMYREGYGTTVSYEQSFEWFLKAKEQGSTYAREVIAHAHLTGDQLPKNYKKAFEYFQVSAESGSSYSMGQLGWMYEKGLYVEKSDNIAREWYEKGEAAGDEFSIEKLIYGW